MIRVALVDDQTLVRQGFRRLLDLAPDMQVVAEAGKVDESVATLLAVRPDVVLLDVRLPDGSGLQVLRELGAQNALPAVLMLTTFPDDKVLLESIRLGARGFLLKDVTLEELLEAIRYVARGGRLLPSTVGNMPSNPSSSQESPTEFRLTGSERKLLGLMMGGHSNRELATLLDVSEGTIKNRVSSILAKLDVRDRSQAMLKALKHRLLE